MQRIFDETMEARFSPYIAQRDSILEELSRTSVAREDIQRLIGMQASRERRRQDLGALRQSQAEVKAAQAEVARGTNSREAVIQTLSSRFGDLLSQFYFQSSAMPILIRVCSVCKRNTIRRTRFCRRNHAHVVGVVPRHI